MPVATDDPVRGAAKDFLLTVVVFSDFQCPFCLRVNPTIEALLKENPDVRYVFRHNPLPFHQQADEAARAALAAHEQGKFWEMHDLLFADQKAMGAGEEEMELLVEGYAKTLGLKMKPFRKAYASDAIAKRIQSDIDLAQTIGARGTPTFFVNGVRLVGAQPLAAFEALITEQREVAKAVAKETGAKDQALYEAVVKANLGRTTVE